jgi:hypothetical protein
MAVKPQPDAGTDEYKYFAIDGWVLMHAMEK